MAPAGLPVQRRRQASAVEAIVNDLLVTAPNGVAWRRRPGGTASTAEFLGALEALTGSPGRVGREWNWWQEGRPEQERDHVMKVVLEWGLAEPPPGG